MSIEVKGKADKRPRVLCVDDEPAVLDSLRRQLYAEFAVIGVDNGPAALALLGEDDSFSVLMSDMRMPGMDGAALLMGARSVRPEAVRILLTGQADMEDAVAAVNDGNIFRFLIKPCPRPVLVKALTDAAEQHRMITAERELLERTFRGSVAALFEVLSLANPLAFARAARIQRIVHQLVEATRPGDSWRIEIAAMLSQIGTVVLAPETVSKLNVGSPLSAEEQLQVHVLPWHAESLLAQNPPPGGCAPDHPRPDHPVRPAGVAPGDGRAPRCPGGSGRRCRPGRADASYRRRPRGPRGRRESIGGWPWALFSAVTARMTPPCSRRCWPPRSLPPATLTFSSSCPASYGRV